MKRFLAGLLVLSTVSLGALGTPHIETRDERFLVTFDAGAVWSCTVYREQRETERSSNFPDGHYTPRHCWSLDKTMRSYTDDWAWIEPYDGKWEVWAEVGYAKDNGSVEYHSSNIITVTH